MTVLWNERLTTLTVPAIESVPSMNADSRQMRCWLIRLLKEDEAEGWVNMGTKEVEAEERVASGTSCIGFATIAIFLIGIGALTWIRSCSVRTCGTMDCHLIFAGIKVKVSKSRNWHSRNLVGEHFDHIQLQAQDVRESGQTEC